MLKVFGVIFLILALVSAILPQFTTCESQGKSLVLANGNTLPMKCKWTAQAELVAAIPLLAVGAMMSFSRRRESRIGLSLIGTISGILVLLIPTSLIGVCSSSMLCNTVMKPTLLVSGSIITVLSLTGLIISIGMKGRMNEFNQISTSKY